MPLTKRGPPRSQTASMVNALLRQLRDLFSPAPRRRSATTETLTVLLVGDPSAVLYWCVDLAPAARTLRLFQVRVQPWAEDPSDGGRRRRRTIRPNGNFHDLVPTGVVRTHSWPPNPPPPPAAPQPEAEHPFDAASPPPDPQQLYLPPQPPTPPPPIAPLQQSVALATTLPSLHIASLIPLGSLPLLSPSESPTSLAVSLARACIDDVRGLTKPEDLKPSKLAGMDGAGEVLARVYLAEEGERRRRQREREEMEEMVRKTAQEETGKGPERLQSHDEGEGKANRRVGAVYLARVVTDKDPLPREVIA